MNKTINNYSRDIQFINQRGFDTVEGSQKDAEIQFLHQQLALLKQELDCECQLTKMYSQALKEKEHELNSLQDKLLTILTMERLEFSEAKELANKIAKSNMSVSESLSELLNGVYKSLAELDEVTLNLQQDNIQVAGVS